MLVVFDPDIVITTEVLAILWNEEPHDAEEIMMSGWSGGEERNGEEKRAVFGKN